ncbi:MAG: SRPBCC family protein [Paracoccaceae bacterium]|nr:SRPBCC family protein [Paracoccaceae bacterium]
MRILKWILGIVVVLALVFVAGGYLLPREVTVARSIEIDAPPGDVFPHVNSLKAGQEWSPWLERDPEVEVTFTGPDEGVGAGMAWSSEQPDVGIGSQEIVLSEPDRRVETALDFGQMGTAKAAFLLEEAGAGTRVTWDLVADMGAGPMGRWMGLMMDGWVGADYEQGLSNLKTLVEG